MTDKKVILGKQSMGHSVQANDKMIVLSFEVDQGYIRVAMDKGEAAQLVSGILNIGQEGDPAAYAEVNADPIDAREFSLSANLNGDRYLGLPCGGVTVAVKLSNEMLSEKLLSPGDDFHFSKEH